MIPPIVFIHRGNSPHLAMAVAQARLTNPHRPITLLGDPSLRHFPALFGIDFHPIADAATTELRAHYRHLSTNGPDFELACLDRWFLLLDWMKTGDVERVIHLDSDVLVYADLTEAERALRAHPMTFVVCSAHTSFVNARATLAKFCDLILEYYRSRQAELDDLHRRHMDQHGAGGISDMTFLRLFAQRHPSELISIDEPFCGDWAFDLTLDAPGYRMRDGIKDLEWRDGVPWGRREPSVEPVRFLTLHFQGACKKWMSRLHSPWPARTRVALLLNRALILRDRILRRLT